MQKYSEVYREELRRIAALSLPFEQLRGRSVLIAGAGGLIASVLTEALLEINRSLSLDLTVYALCRNAEKAKARFGVHAENPAFQLVIQDVCDALPQDLQTDYIVQAASNAHPLAYARQPVETMKANLFGTMQLLEHAVQAKAVRFLLVSSSEVYGENTAQAAGMDEQFQGKLLNTMQARACYPESKRAAETLCAAYRQEYGLDVTVVRPGYIYGAAITADNSRADAQFLRNVLAHEDIVMKSRGEQQRSYCYVADAVSAILYVLLRGENGEAYNIADPGCRVCIRDFAEALAAAGKVKVRFELPPEEEARGYSKVSNSLLCADKLVGLGWHPQYSLEQGTAQTVSIAAENAAGKAPEA